MPFVQINLAKQASSEKIKKDISLSVHESLIEAYNIPTDDYFQVIRELDPVDLMYPESYMGISHTANMVYIQIIARVGRTVDMKKTLYRLIADKITSRTSISRNDIVIVLVENTPEDWSFGQGLAQYV